MSIHRTSSNITRGIKIQIYHSYDKITEMTGKNKNSCGASWPLMLALPSCLATQ